MVNFGINPTVKTDKIRNEKVKMLRRTLICAGILALLNLTQGQSVVDSGQTSTTDSVVFIPPMNPNGRLPPLATAFEGIQINNVTLDITSVADLDTMLGALQAAPPVPYASLPQNPPANGYWSLKNPYWPPLPGNVLGLDSWLLGNGNLILDDRLVDYDALDAAATSPSRTRTALRPMMMMASSLSTAYAYGNPVYLTNMAASLTNDGSVTASFSIVGGTNFVPYDILSTTNLTIPVGSWSWIGLGYTTNHYSFSEQPAGSSYYILAKPSQTMTVGLGDDTLGQCDVPYGLTNALQVAGGIGQSIALKIDGTVVAWGANRYGQGLRQ